MEMMAETATFDFEEEWVNYGDVNPEPHGGRFVRWDGEEERWEIVETVCAAAAMPNGSEDAQIVSKYYPEPQDVWVDGEPSKGFTDDMESILEALGDEHHKEAPGGEPFMSRIAYYVADFTHYLRGRSTVEDMDFGDFEDYESLVASYGVENWE